MLTRVTARIRPHALDDLLEALDDVGVQEVTVLQGRGFTGRLRRERYRGAPYLALDERLLVEVIVRTEFAELVAQLMAANARAAGAGAGTISLSAIEATIDVRTGTRHRDTSTP